jgi:signal transduction histidine kinase
LNYTAYILFTFLSLLYSRVIYGSDVVVLNDSLQEYILTGSTIDILEDTTMALSLQQVVAMGDEHPQWNVKKGPQVNNRHAVYWVKFTLNDLSTDKYHWLLEFYDNRLDEITVYIPNKEGKYVVLESGDKKPFSEKDFLHINYVFDFPVLSHTKPSTVYVRLYAAHEIYIYGLVRSVQRFVSYTTLEYFYVTVFYGILLAMALYNFSIMLFVRERSYLYYILYVVSVGLYSFSRDGFGYQFIWPNHPYMNHFMEPLSLCCITITLLLYAREFLNTKAHSAFLDQLILYIIFIRALVFVAGVCLPSIFIRNMYFDIPLILLAYFAGFRSYQKGYKASRYYIIGFTALFIGFCIILAEDVGFPINSIYSFYSFNFGVVIQLVVLSIALADRVRILLKEQEQIKDQLNIQLEEKVKERTIELQDKNEQLDSFVYKASHDIKGPLRSIMGLTNVGMVDFKKSPEVVHYFEHIMKTATKLDMVLEDLLLVTKIKNTQLQYKEIAFQKMVQEVLQTFNHLNGFERVKLTLEVETQLPLITDETVLYSVVQNLIENVIKYQDEKKEETLLSIRLAVKPKLAKLVVKDNGTGIEPSHLNHIFDMFYKINERSIGSGLGLYILKQAVQRLNGKVVVKSVLGKGTTFIVELPQ